MRRRDASELSQLPHNIRKRLRRRSGTLQEDFEMYALVTQRYKPLEEWDYEELRRGKPRNADGSFMGRKPRWITPLIQKEISRRLRDHVLDEINNHAADAVAVLVEFVKDKDVKDELRFRAAQLILEYVAGKPNANVNIEGNIKLDAVLAGALVLDDQTPAHPVLEGFVVEKDDLGVGSDAD